VAASTDDIQVDIADIKQRMIATAGELDARLGHLPRLARWTISHWRAIAAVQTVMIGLLWVVGSWRRRSGE